MQIIVISHLISIHQNTLHHFRSGEIERPERLLCGAVKLLRSSRAKPDTVTWLSLMHLAKRIPDLFCSDYVRDALCSLLKRDMRESFKSKGNCLVSVLAANVLYIAFQARFYHYYKHIPISDFSRT